MTSSFSWTDRAHIALNTCLPCLRRSTSTDSLSRHTTDDFRGLLVDPDPDVLSLRSPGSDSARKRSAVRSITLFGFHLFGRTPSPPIQLPPHSDDALYHTTSTPTTSDSDAALLDAENLPTRVAAAEEEERRANKERRARRRERREVKKLARALSANANAVDEFEGFQGSGNVFPDIPPSFSQAEVVVDDEDQAADLDGVVYTRRRPTSNQGSDSRSSSDKHKFWKTKSKSTHSSRTTDSRSLASPTNPTFFPSEPDTITTVVSPTTTEQGHGLLDYRHQVYTHSMAKDGFPSTGLGMRTNGQARGAFLANKDLLFDGAF